MKKYIILLGIMSLLLISFYLFEKTEKYEGYEPSPEQIKAEDYVYCMEGCDWDEECVKRNC